MMENVDSVANPYESGSIDTEQTQAFVGNDGRCEFGKIIRRWERLRILYNAFLTVVVVTLAIFVFTNVVSDLVFWCCVIVGALIANLCFFTAPAIEGYGTYFGFWHPVFTIILFLVGLGLATLMAIGSVVNYASMR